MEISIFLIRDIMSVMSDHDEAILHVDEEGRIVVTHLYRGHNIATWFKSNGIMWIYETDCTDIEVLKNLDHALYDNHWGMGSDCRAGYRKAIAKIVGE